MNIRGKTEGKEMGYALFAQRKVVLDGQLNNAQLMQTMKSNEQFKLATQKLGKDQELGSLKTSQAQELAALYEDMANAGGEEQRQSIQAQISAMELQQEREIDAINREIYQISVQEQAIEMQVKRLDTVVTALQKQLEAVEEAEGQAIDRATPKFNGVG